MKIIKMGNLTITRNTCPYCNCEYEYNEADVQTGYDLTFQYAYVICPCCCQINRINTLPPNKYYPQNPVITFEAHNHIPTLDGQQISEEVHKYWNPDIKEDKKDGDD